MSDDPSDTPCIVVVDDDVDQLFLTLKLLEKAKLRNRIIAIRSGTEAMQFLSSCCEAEHLSTTHLPALILLDLHMPRVDGFAVLDWIKKTPPLSTVKVVVLSSSENPNDVERCTSLGAHGFMTKRNSPTLLDFIVHEVIGND